MWTALPLPFRRGSTTSWKLERLSLDVLDKEKELWLLDYRLTNYFHVSLAHTWMTATSMSEGNDWLIENPWWEMSAACSKCCYLGYYNLFVTLPGTCREGTQPLNCNNLQYWTLHGDADKNCNSVLGWKWSSIKRALHVDCWSAYPPPPEFVNVFTQL